MSELSISPYFPFRRIKITKQTVDEPASKAIVKAVPDKRFKPVCHLCGQKVSSVHSLTQRSIRDLNLASTKVWIHCEYRKLSCSKCKRISIEELGFFHPYIRITRRMALYIHELCKVMTVTEVAQHLQLDWKTVKEIDKQYLEIIYGQPSYDGLRILAVDEISLRKGHNYLTIVLDYETGRVIHVGKGRKAKTLTAFFNHLSAKQRKSIEAVVMDMWDPFIRAVKKNFLKRLSFLTCSMSLPLLAALLIKYVTVNTGKRLKKIKMSLKEQNICS